MLLKRVVLITDVRRYFQGGLNQSLNIVPAVRKIKTNSAPGIVNKKFIYFDATEANERSKLKLFDEF